MKTIFFRDEQLQAEKIVKTANAIYGYVNGAQVFSFEGISNFAGFRLAEGQVFDEPEPTIEEQLNELKQENVRIRATQIEQDSILMSLLLGGDPRDV